MEFFAERMKEIRKQKNISQQKMAEMLDINIRLYQYYESKSKTPSITNALKIAIVLNVSLDYLCGRTNKQEVNN